MAPHLRRGRRRHSAVICGLLGALVALFIITEPFTSTGQEQPSQGEAMMGIAPLESDLMAMQRTLRSLESLINERTPGAIEALISPRVSEPQRRGIILSTEGFVSALPPESVFHLRTDVGRGAIVPIGPERIQVQVSSTRITGETRQTGRVDIELEAVETDGQRRWLLVEASYPGQRLLLTGGFPIGLLVAIVAVVSTPIVGIILWAIRRRLRTRKEEKDSAI